MLIDTKIAPEKVDAAKLFEGLPPDDELLFWSTGYYDVLTESRKLDE